MSVKSLSAQKLLLLLIFIQLVLIFGHIYYQLYYWPKENLRIVYLDSERVKSRLSPYGPGLEQELVDIFCRQNGLKATWSKVENLEEGLKKLRLGLADLFIGLTTKDEFQDDRIKFGPAYLRNNFIVVHNRFRFPLRRPDELCRVVVFIPDKEIFEQKLISYQKKLSCSIKAKRLIPKMEKLYQAITKNKARFALTDRISFNHWHPYFVDVRKTYSFDDTFDYKWCWSTRYSELNSMLTVFWDNFFGSTEFFRLKEKYYGFFPSRIDYYELDHLMDIVELVLPKYDQYILEAARLYNIDPLLLVAMIYQESHFNPRAKSKTGVRGLLQLSLDTASYVGISNRIDPEQSILGGAKYLRFLGNKIIKEKGVNGWDGWFFALAAYNQGPGHLYDAMDLAKRLKKDHLSWMGLKEVFPLLSYKKYYRTVKRGYCRGFEAVDYVQSIRYYYYILHGLVVLGRPEAKHLASFLDFVPPDWPN